MAGHWYEPGMCEDRNYLVGRFSKECIWHDKRKGPQKALTTLRIGRKGAITNNAPVAAGAHHSLHTKLAVGVVIDRDEGIHCLRRGPRIRDEEVEVHHTDHHGHNHCAEGLHKDRPREDHDHHEVEVNDSFLDAHSSRRVGAGSGDDSHRVHDVGCTHEEGGHDDHSTHQRAGSLLHDGKEVEIVSGNDRYEVRPAEAAQYVS